MKHLFILLFVGTMILNSGLYGVNENDSENVHKKVDEKISLNEHDLKKGKIKLNIGIMLENAEEVHAKLEQLLLNIYQVYYKTQYFYWDLNSKYSYDLHKILKKKYKFLAECIDKISERIMVLGARHFSKSDILKIDASQDELTVFKLRQYYQTIIDQIRSIISYSMEINDWGTHNFLSELIRKFEKTAWELKQIEIQYRAY